MDVRQRHPPRRRHHGRPRRPGGPADAEGARAVSERIIIIGGGPNGLAAAGLLAKAGRDVLLLEARDRLGGLAARDTFHEGYAAPGVLHDTRGLRPHVVEALDLARYGLRFRPAPLNVWAPTAAGGVWITQDGLIGDVDEAENVAYAKLRALIERVRPVVARVMDGLPLSPESSLWSLLRTGWALRRLGPETMMELLRVAPMSVADWMRDTFASERVRAALALPALLGQHTGPRSPHTATNLLVQEALAGPGVLGGAAALVGHLAEAAEAQGAVLRRGTRVARIDGDRDGVTGVTLDDGERLRSRVVLSTLDPKTTFLSLFDRRQLPVDFVRDVERYRMRGSTASMQLALTAPLRTAGGERVEAMRTGETLDDLERAFDGLKYRRRAEAPVLEAWVPSAEDPTLCPEGHAVVSVLVHGVPRDLAGGWTAGERDAVGDAVIRTLTRYFPSLPEHLVDAEVLTPEDIEARFGVAGGHLLHGEHAPDQLLFMRPTRQAGQYRTPIPRLYVGGASSHPGGGVTCGPGALAARAILRAKAGVEPAM
ncbi:MAG: NAD(P)/FAD-dependent oxidoreductase [Deltaproteobacteria bacterium]|nr:MAG: NAD(P)/FAD-dependent oxidoreductase [Deltaproteobacteria bacterium]